MLTLNLLPPKEKEKVKLELTFAFLVEFGAQFIFLALIFTGLLFSIYLYSSILTGAQIGLIAVEKQAIQEERFRKIEEDLRKSNDTVEEVLNLESQFFAFAKIIEDLAGFVPKGIYLKNLTITPGGRKISLVGLAPTREIMLNFKKNLEGSQKFSDVYSPISNLLVPKDVNFAFTITLK